jgi:hypothetical protein
VSAQKSLTAALQRQVLLMEDDLRVRVEQDEPTRQRWQAEHRQAVTHRRTAASWQAWRDDRVTQAAVAWVLTTVFVRFCEDNRLVEPVWIAGPPQRWQEALDAELTFYRERSSRGEDVTARDWLLQAVAHLAELKATAPLVDEHAALHLVAPSGDAAGALLEFWRERGDDGALVRDLTDELLDTRFLGDLYQDLSEHAKATFALLQTPEFVEEFILDQTLEPALAERPLEGFRLIDPTCGSGHFLLGAFDRLLDRWQQHAPGLERQALVQEALDAIHGVDLNPFAVAIARFRLTIAALKASGLHSVEDAPGFAFHLAVGDSLLHGTGRQTLEEDADLSLFTYPTEDLVALQGILADGRYDVVVGNPPYITVKDKELNREYRERYPKTCKGTYAMTVPFMERFYRLAKQDRHSQPAGWVGQITANSFMKREFGSRLIEDFLVNKDLRLVADTSGAHIPGHGTPTVILVGRNRRPAGSTLRAALGVRGEPGRPDDPAKGLVWRSLVEHIDEPGWNDSWVSITDLNRALLAKHPWSLSGGRAATLVATLNLQSRTLGSLVGFIGYTGQTNADPAFLASPADFRRRRVDPAFVRQFVNGEAVRDFVIGQSASSIFPYNERGLQHINGSPGALKWLWPSRTVTWARATFSKNTYRQEGRTWWEWHQVALSRITSSWSIAYPNVATHNHFAIDRIGRLFNPHAPFVKLPIGAGDAPHHALLGALSSSTACFWLKQNSHEKAGSGIGRGVQDEAWGRAALSSPARRCRICRCRRPCHPRMVDSWTVSPKN